ncbi:MAG: hypothetical protein H0T69_14185, partial [Thermoleophilaceae bacterium]|nr:hypothetical protein [Thermoleophilaceae bacterium]
MRRRTATLLCLVVCVAATSVIATTAGAVDQTAKNGCESPQPYSGVLTSPLITTSSEVPTVSGQWWFEGESVAPVDHDLAIVEYTIDGGLNWTELGRLNPASFPGGAADQGYSNRGLGKAPAFQPFSFALPAASSVQIR